MEILDPARHGVKLRALLAEERPGPLVAEHVIATGRGALLADDPDAPRMLLAMSGGNRALRGEADPGLLRSLAARLAGLIDAPPHFEVPLRAVLPALRRWPRVILAAAGSLRSVPTPRGIAVRRLRAADAAALWSLPDTVDWISDTWGGAPGLADCERAFGAFAEHELLSVAAPFFVGSRYEDIGVITIPGQRGRGLSPACAAAAMADIKARGRIPSWSTAPENLASLRVAEKLGFETVRADRLFVVGQEIPAAAEAEHE